MSTNNSSEESEEMPELIRSNTPTSSTDIIHVGISENGAVLMQLISVIPDAMIENHRTVLNPESVETFIDILCEATDYYPKKPKKKKSKKRKPATSKK